MLKKLRKYANNVVIKKIIEIVFHYMPEESIVKMQYRHVLNRKLNISRPVRFSEKIQWYKLHYQDPLMTQCADKYRVREYIEKKGFSKTLVKLYQVCDTFEEINFDNLPNSFVIKSNKGSGTNIFVKNKNELNFKKVKKQIRQWSTPNTVLLGREWSYKNIEHKIIIEEMLVADGNGINDYKFLTFNGEVKFIWVDTDRQVDHRRNFYDIDWNLLNIQSDWPNTNYDIPKPQGFEQMIKIAEDIGKDFPFARVDFYWENNKIYFGEITFYPWSGCIAFTPDSFDIELGECFKLPHPLYN